MFTTCLDIEGLNKPAELLMFTACLDIDELKHLSWATYV